jgi:hypothetical protein
MENQISNNKALALSKFDKVLSFENYQQLKDFATDLVNSDLVDSKNPQDIIISMMIAEEIGLKPTTGILLGKKLNAFTVGCVLRGKSLGFDAITSMEKTFAFKDKSGENIKTGIAVDLLTASLLKAGVTIRILKDYAPLYGYADNKGTLYHPLTINWEMYQLVNKATKKEEVDPTKIPVVHTNQPVDYITEIEFKRTIKKIDGTCEDVVHVEKVYFNDYKHLHNKDNWTNYGKDMLRTRCLGKGSRFIGNDLVNGANTIDELLDADFVSTEEADFVVVEDPVKEVIPENKEVS